MSLFNKLKLGEKGAWKPANLLKKKEPQSQDAAEATPRRNPFRVLWEGFCSNIPTKEDSTSTKVRKCGFLLSLLVMVAAIIYLIIDLLVIPALNNRLKNDLIGMYHPDDESVVDSSDGQYPEEMLSAFRDLYDRNSDVRGWISFHADGNKDFLNIEYPIVYKDEDNYTNSYLKQDFDGNRSRNGTLYFDRNNRLESHKDKNRSLIVYGHNMASGQMLAGLNKLLNSVGNARSCPTLTLSTLFRRDEYLVFAVILTDESDRTVDHYFNPRRTEFSSDEDFLDYVADMRAHSIYDYPVEVEKGDHILVLSTCTGKTSAHVKDGRMILVARRARIGEEVEVDTNAIQKNEDVIMPFYWYLNQKKTPHPLYNYVPPKPAKTTKKKKTTKTTTVTTEAEETTSITETTDTTDTTETTETTDAESTTETGQSTDTKTSTDTSKKTTTKTEDGKDTTTASTAVNVTTGESTAPTESTTVADTTADTTTSAKDTTTATETTTEKVEDTTTTEKTTESTGETTTTTVETTEPSAEPTTEE